jgi:hypothetical protein
MSTLISLRNILCPFINFFDKKNRDFMPENDAGTCNKVSYRCIPCWRPKTQGKRAVVNKTGVATSGIKNLKKSESIGTNHLLKHDTSLVIDNNKKTGGFDLKSKPKCQKTDVPVL